MSHNSGRRSISRFMSSIACAALLVTGATAAFAFTPWYASGSGHTVVLNPDGTVWTLGQNRDGQLGNGRFGGQSDEPAAITGLRSVTAIAARGTTSVALKKDGTVWAWGSNAAGQLGDGTTVSRNVPVKVTGLADVTAIAAGATHILALQKDGSVWAWGGNGSGQLGRNLATPRSMAPVRVPGLPPVAAIAAGAFHSAALTSDGTVWTWGSNSAGQLGVADLPRSAAPLPVSGLSGIKAIAAGNYHLAALQQDGTVAAWGSNFYRQLGDGTVSRGSATPVTVDGLAAVRDLTARANHTVALKENGSLWAWGDENAGQWGNGVSMDGSSVPVQLCGVNRFTTLAAVGDPATVRGGSALAADRPAPVEENRYASFTLAAADIPLYPIR